MMNMDVGLKPHGDMGSSSRTASGTFSPVFYNVHAPEQQASENGFPGDHHNQPYSTFQPTQSSHPASRPTNSELTQDRSRAHHEGPRKAQGLSSGVYGHFQQFQPQQPSYSNASNFLQHPMQPQPNSFNDGNFGTSTATEGGMVWYGQDHQQGQLQNQRSHPQPPRQQYSIPSSNYTQQQQQQQHVDPQTSSTVGWGGQSLHDSAGQRVPWFGRNRSKFTRGGPPYASTGQDGTQPSSSHSHVWDGGGYSQNMQLGGNQTHQAPLEGALSVEEIVSVIKQLRRYDPLPDTVFRALAHLDSRAMALLLKDLSRGSQDKRANELFDWVRALPPNHRLRSLCDVYTFTAMISLCVFQQDVQRAFELVDDMRRAGIEPNVHTNTALMNVCIKCGKPTVALNIYKSMRQTDCSPNVVTYNTLIDVYGKLGQWEDAVRVIDVMQREGVTPVLRTFNTLIIGCNMCSQPRAAVATYHRLLSDGFIPNSTTYNALISSYGKTGQLDKALDLYQEMRVQAMERCVITYSSLISACEKAGQWETALRIFAEMQRDGCAPNTITFNSLITACAQGGQWDKANEVLEQMTSQSCMPDVVTYTALISAYERGGRWQSALQVFHKMCVQGCKPDAIVYNAIIDTLWATGIIWAQSKALHLFQNAQQQGQFRHRPFPSKVGRLELILHAMSAGVAMLSLYCWLMEIRRIVVEQGEDQLPATLTIVTDVGKVSREQGNCIVKEAVAASMDFWGAPFRPTKNSMYMAVLESTGPQVAAWVTTPSFSAYITSHFPMVDASKASEESYTSNEANLQASCTEAFQHVSHFENTHSLVVPNMSVNYMQQRPVIISRMLDITNKLSLQDEAVHDAVLLLDRAASSTTVEDEELHLLGVSALVIAAEQGGLQEHGLDRKLLEELTDLPAASVKRMEWQIRRSLNSDTAAISTMRCLKIYLSRLGYQYLNKQDVYGLAGFAIMLTVESLYDMSLLNCRPSIVATAILYAERRMRGAIPFWPSMLSKLTGYVDMGMPELNSAVRVAQKVARKVVYSQMYRAQLMQLVSEPQDAPQKGSMMQADPFYLQQQDGNSGGPDNAIPHWAASPQPSYINLLAGPPGLVGEANNSGRPDLHQIGNLSTPNLQLNAQPELGMEEITLLTQAMQLVSAHSRQPSFPPPTLHESLSL